MNTAKQYNRRTDAVLAYLQEHPNEELTNRQVADALGFDTKEVANSIHSLRTYRKEPVVRVGRGRFLFKPEGLVNSQRARQRTEAKREAVRENVTGARKGRPMSDRAVQAKRERHAKKLHRRAVVLYELMEAAPKNKNGAFASNVKDLVADNPQARKEFIFGGKFAPGGVYAAHTYLLENGAIRTEGPTYRYLVQHPDDIFPDRESGIRGNFVPEESTTVAFERGTPRPAVPTPTRTKTERTVDAVDSVPSDDLAAAVAEAMWLRYEHAMTEIGRLTDLLAGRDQEIARLQAIVDEMPEPTANDYARRMLTGAKKR